MRELRFGTASNALIEVPGGANASGGGFTLRPANGAETTFFVRRASPGGAATVPLVIVDDCGELPTFVGGGPDAF